MSESADKSRVVIRPLSSVVIGALVVAFIAFLIVDTVRRGSGAGAWALAAGLAFGGLVIWLTSVWPAVIAEPSHLVLRNPLRVISIPWSAIDDLRLRFQLDVHVADATYHAWAVPVSGRSRRRQQRRQLRHADVAVKLGRQAAEYADKGQDAPGFAERALLDLSLVREQRVAEEKASAAESASRDVVVRWSWPYIAALVGLAVVFIVALILR